jgi:hypothetical protein
MGGKGVKLFHAALIFALVAPSLASAQTTPRSASPSSLPPEGPTAFLQAQGASTPLGLVIAYDIDIGYNLTSHLGADIGFPFVSVRSPLTLEANRDFMWTTLVAEPYVAVHYTTTKAGANITSVLTGTIPAANSIRIFSTGRFGVDWFNHIEPEGAVFKGFRPFLNAAASNGAVNRFYMPRPYTTGRPYQTLGFMGDFEGGATYEVRKHYKIGASAYAIVPAGPQKVFSRLVTPGSSVVGDANHGRVFYSAFETVGHEEIDRDNGYSGWLELTSARNVNVQIGYTRSVKYALDSLTLVVNLDATALMRTITGRK